MPIVLIENQLRGETVQTDNAHSTHGCSLYHKATPLGIVVVLCGLGLWPALGHTALSVSEKSNTTPPLSTDAAIPKTPPGLDACLKPIAFSGELPRQAGELIRYHVDAEGLQLGTVDFKIERRGTLEGKPVTEYRSAFQIDSLVSAIWSTAGRAASVVAEKGDWPIKTMHRYNLRDDKFEEDVAYGNNGQRLESTRSKNGSAKQDKRAFMFPVSDFLSAFYRLRGLGKDTSGCVVVYSDQRAYTIWITAEGKDKVKTPVGSREAYRYQLRYGHDKGKRILNAMVWLSTDGNRIPYKAEMLGETKVTAQVHLYQTKPP